MKKNTEKGEEQKRAGRVKCEDGDREAAKLLAQGHRSAAVEKRSTLSAMNGTQSEDMKRRVVS